VDEPDARREPGIADGLFTARNGMLTGKYWRTPAGWILQAMFELRPQALDAVQPVLGLLGTMGERYSKT
jgi:hypothetical protein